LFGIVIVAHAGLADEYLSAMEHVVGKQPQTAAVPIAADSDRDERQRAICGAVAEVDKGDGVVLVTDGANLPLLVKLATLRKKPINDAIEEAITAARKYINCTDDVARS